MQGARELMGIMAVITHGPQKDSLRAEMPEFSLNASNYS
jgi:hypothetical protein